jgi:hypothetical protein
MAVMAMEGPVAGFGYDELSAEEQADQQANQQRSVLSSKCGDSGGVFRRWH